MTQFVRDHGRDFAPVEHAQQSLCDGYHAVLRVASGSKRVRRVLGHDEYPGRREVGTGGELLDHPIQVRRFVRAYLARVVHPPLVRNLGAVRFRGLLLFAAGASIALAVTVWGWYRIGFAIPAAQLSWLRFWEHMMLAWDQPLKESLIRFGSMLLLNFPP